MKTKLFVFLLLSPAFYVKAQHNLSVGIDVNNQVTGLSLIYGAKSRNILIHGFGIGVLKSFKADKIQLKSGLSYQFSTLEFENIPHGVLQNGAVNMVGTMDQEVKQNFISLPITINYTVLQLNKSAFQVFGGTQFLYQYRTKYEQTSTYNGETEGVTQPNDIHALMDVGLSFYFKPQDRIQLFVKPKYSYLFKELPFSKEKNVLGVNLELYYNLR